MLSKSTQKWIRSLEQKKFRLELGLFVAEGHKLTTDLLAKLPCRLLIYTSDWIKENKSMNLKGIECIETDFDDIKKISFLKNPQKVLAVFEIPASKLSFEDTYGKLNLVLDNIQDPGNLGTIIRIADWFGIENIICSKDTVDAYNPKTVQATMGAIARVHIYYEDLYTFITNSKINVFGTFLEGDNIYKCNLPEEALIVMGNEGNGISDQIAGLIDKKLLIPDYPAGKTSSESLNVAVATAIVCSEFRRRMF